MSGRFSPRATSWLDVPAEHHFPIQNLPFGVFEDDREPARIGVRIGDFALDLGALADAGLIDAERFPGGNLLDHLSISDARALREQVFDLLVEGAGRLRDDARSRERALIQIERVRMHRPFSVGAFVDFYASEHHATNVGKMFRPQGDPLLPNWKHLPVGYNGRASTVMPGDVAIVRPQGQFRPPGGGDLLFGPSRELDFELELGFFLGAGNALWQPIPPDRAEHHIFGLVLVDDWSARDVQRWEYQPLGPFLGKSFATTISPWVVTLDALAPWRVEGPKQDPEPLPYLRGAGAWHFDIHLEVALQTPAMSTPQTLTRSNARNLYWSFAQMLAHQTVNGTHVQEGDLYASGTVSGPTPDSLGCLLELTWNGERPVVMTETGETRTYVEDGDTVVLRGWCQGDGYRVGFGELRNRVYGSVEAWHGDAARAQVLETA